MRKLIIIVDQSSLLRIHLKRENQGLRLMSTPYGNSIINCLLERTLKT